MSEAELRQVFDRDYGNNEGANSHSLHWSANTLASMGATISASSDGPGQGTEFRILLQAAKPGTVTDG